MSAIRGISALAPGRGPMIVAEISGNHGGSLERALAIVEAVAASGAHAVKLQTYTADTMTLDVNRPEFVVSDPQSLWRGETLHALYRRAHTPWEWHEPILRRARELGLFAFSSVFDSTAVDFLENLDVPAYKIASFENTDLPLIRRAAATGKPLIVSTGMATVEELDEAVGAARASGCQELVLLKCTSSYPADPAESNLAAIPTLGDRYGCPVGLSDHTLGIGVAVASVAFGAVMIEKHVTLDRDAGSVDAAFSLEPSELAQLVRETRAAAAAIGSPHIGSTGGEEPERPFRRSLYLVQDVRPGDLLTAANLRAIRPGMGLPPKYYDELLGRRVAVAAAKGTPMSWDLLEPRETAE